jgi:hypothetical protein
METEAWELCPVRSTFTIHQLRVCDEILNCNIILALSPMLHALKKWEWPGDKANIIYFHHEIWINYSRSFVFCAAYLHLQPPL